jgi:hypothetical protein
MRTISIVALSLLLLFSCSEKEEDGMVTFTVKSTNVTPNGRAFALDNSKTRIYFSNFKFKDAEDKEVLVKDIFLYSSTNTSFTFSVPKGNYTLFEFAFGLDAVQNANTPASFSASHPLSVENGMFWDMLKYRFLVVEGNIDNSPTKDQTPATPFSMHLGTDTLYTRIAAVAVPKSGEVLNIELDLDKLFVLDADPFQLINFSNHSEFSEIPRTVAIKNSFVSGIKTTVTP